ncbi:MAG TPA: rhodanese-like domain-containing protein [Candidatus Limnocylindrales bacterium]|nr:rhodanese-like domain-containing protein [Candidatus Limnocylindrales bacterium]
MMPAGVPSIAPRDAAAATDPSTATDPATRPLIVDVREADEFSRERVAGAVLLPISQFVARHRELPKDRPLLMLCHSGSRSTSATMYLLQSGWPDVRNVTGGIIGWRYAGLPIVTGAPAPGEGDLEPAGPLAPR